MHFSVTYPSMNTKVLSSISDPRYLRLLQKCSTMDQLKQIHAQITASGLSPFSYISSKLLAFCAISDAGDINYAHTIFEQISAPTVFDFNTMIMGCSKTSNLELGLSIYTQMRTRRLTPDHRTFPVLAKSCGSVSSLFQVHGQIIKFGHGSDVYVISSLICNYSKLEAIQPARQVFDESSYRNVVCYTSLITGYCSNGFVEEAHKMFEEMPEKNDVSYSAMISGFVRNGLCYEAIDLFRKLREDANVKPCRSTFVCILIACGALGALDEGKHVHSLLAENSLDRELEIGTTLIDFYAKCGNIDKAQEVFRKMPSKDVATWSVMILGLAMNGKNDEALELFVEMEKIGPVPNAITFIGVLTACHRQDLVTEAWQLFGKMTKVYGLSPIIEHYGCMVDLLVRAGQVERAEILIKCMPMEADGAIWGSFLNGCMINNRMQLGERAGKLLIELEPQHSGRYVLLSNLYANLGSWENAIRLRRMMEERKVAPTRGWSFIEVGGVTYTFSVDDKHHSEWRHIRKLTAELNKVLTVSSVTDYLYKSQTHLW